MLDLLRYDDHQQLTLSVFFFAAVLRPIQLELSHYLRLAPCHKLGQTTRQQISTFLQEIVAKHLQALAAEDLPSAVRQCDPLPNAAPNGVVHPLVFGLREPRPFPYSSESLSLADQSVPAVMRVGLGRELRVDGVVQLDLG
jgi:hypothetical protein